MKFILIITGLIYLGIEPIYAQEDEEESLLNAAQTDTTKRGVSIASIYAPSFYIDCRRCDFDFIRTELNFVNYVRDPELADVHVFVTDEQTGGGGREYQFSFIGRRKFQGISYTLNHVVERDATLSERREAIIRMLKQGFASFVFQTPLGKQFSIEYNMDESEELLQAEDPWDFWVFQGYIGSVRFHLESNQSIFNSRWGIFADRVTEDWKLRFRPYFNYGRRSIQTSETEEQVVSEQRRHGIDSHVIKSLTDHWSAGIVADYFTYNSRNIKHHISVRPGIEYSIFPYEEAVRKAITFRYLVGYMYYDYYEETLYNKVQERLLSHQFRGDVNIQQPWGSIETGFIGSQYLQKTKHFRAELYGQTSVRLFEGFSLRFHVEYEVIRDQLSLPKGGASLEDILLQQRELSTDFSFSSSVAITYTFGSQFANVVNTRF
ncbi:MAG: hypothetical protein ACOC0R_01770 [Mariniphaga sp.]